MKEFITTPDPLFSTPSYSDYESEEDPLDVPIDKLPSITLRRPEESSAKNNHRDYSLAANLLGPVRIQ